MSGDRIMTTHSDDNRSTLNIVKTISTLISDIVNENKEELKSLDIHISVFNSKKPLSISINNYIERIYKYCKIDESTLTITLIYIDRLCDITELHNDVNVHRIVLVTVLIAIKYNENDYYSNDYYAKVGGITLNEINYLEYECIKLLSFQLFVEEDYYKKYEVYSIHYQR